MGGRGGAGGSNGVGQKSTPAKIGDSIVTAKWFDFDLPDYAIKTNRATIIGESASGKAWKVRIETETLDGERDLVLTRYMPKSAALSPSEQAKAAKEAAARYKDGQNKYNKLIDFAKKNGIKGVRVGMRKDTILERIKKAGLFYKW